MSVEHPTTEQDIVDLIVSWYEPDWTEECQALHQRIAQAKFSGTLTDELLNQCTHAECAACARICCPDHEPLHFHHDGCPACDMP